MQRSLFSKVRLLSIVESTTHIKKIQFGDEFHKLHLDFETPYGSFKSQDRTTNLIRIIDNKFLAHASGDTTEIYEMSTGEKTASLGSVIPGVLIEEGYITDFKNGHQRLHSLEDGRLISDQMYFVYLPSLQLSVHCHSATIDKLQIGNKEFYTQFWRLCDQGIYFRTVENKWYLNTDLLEGAPTLNRHGIVAEDDKKYNSKVLQEHFKSTLLKLQLPGTRYLKTSLARTIPELLEELHVCCADPVIQLPKCFLDVDIPYSRQAEVRRLVDGEIYISYSGNMHFFPTITTEEELFRCAKILLQEKIPVDLYHLYAKYSSVFLSMRPILKKELSTGRTVQEFLDLCGVLQCP